MGRQVKLVAQALALAVVAGLLGLLIWDVSHKNEATGFVDRIAAGKAPAAPPLALKPLSGGTGPSGGTGSPGGNGKISLASYRGKVVVLNFWASWCGPCKAEAPRLEAASRRWAKQGVVFLGVDANDFSSDAKHFLAKHDVSYLNLEDGSGSSIGHWGVTGFPETFFIDRQGRAVDHVAQEIKADQIEDGIRKALS